MLEFPTVLIDENLPHALIAELPKAGVIVFDNNDERVRAFPDA